MSQCEIELSGLKITDGESFLGSITRRAEFAAGFARQQRDEQRCCGIWQRGDARAAR